MKTTCFLLTAFLSVMTACAQTNDRLRLIEVTELTQEVSFHVVTEAGFQLLQADMSVKNHLFPKAMDLAAKKWSDDYPESGPFPRQTAEKGQVESIETFTDKEKAMQALKARQAHEEEQEKKKLTGIERQLALMRDQLRDVRELGSSAVEKEKEINSLQANIKFLEDQVARKKKREGDRESNLILSRQVFQTVLNGLLAEARKKNTVTNATRNAVTNATWNVIPKK